MTVTQLLTMYPVIHTTGYVKLRHFPLPFHRSHADHRHHVDDHVQPLLRRAEYSAAEGWSGARSVAGQQQSCYVCDPSGGCLASAWLLSGVLHGRCVQCAQRHL